MDKEAVLELIRKVKEETKSELREEFSEQLARQQQQIDEVAAYYTKLADPRLAFFTSGEPSSAGSRSNLDPVIIQHRRDQKNIALQHGPCMGCGGDGSNSTSGLSCAHIVGNTGVMSNYDVWNSSSSIANYSSDIDPYSSANLLVLCGTKGEQGTCHNAYDKHIISLYYDDAGGDYVWWVRLPDFRTHNGVDIHNQHVAIANPKYRRLLAWRTLAATTIPGPNRAQTVAEKVAFVDMLLKSEAGEQL